MAEQLYTCDLCTKAVFHTREALKCHVEEKHASFTPGREELLKYMTEIRPAIFSNGYNVPLLEAYGKQTFEMANSRDAGANRLKQACDARSQLELIVRKWKPDAEVYVFGSSVAMGLWDGLSDIDCTVVDVKSLDAGDWPPNEKTAVRSLASIFRNIGFTFQNLEAIEHARVPIIKHNATVPALKILGEKYERLLARTIRCLFDCPLSPADRAQFEIRCSEWCQGAIDTIWWDAGYRSCGVTLNSTHGAVELLLAVTQNEKSVAAAPIHEEYRPELFHVDFDLSFRTFGIRNSYLLRAYLTAHPCARPGALVLKDWSKQCGVNNSINGFLTSYAVNIMWIFFLYRKGHVPYVDPKSIPARLSASDQSKDPVYMPLIPPEAAGNGGALQHLHEQMGRLLLDFFVFYVFEFDWSSEVVSLNKSTPTTKADLGWTESDEVRLSKRNTRYMMCIEDPYEENLNLGRHLGECRSRKIMTELQRGLAALTRDQPTGSVLFAEVKKSNANSNPSLADVTRLLAAAATSSVDGPIPVQLFRQQLENSCNEALSNALEHWEWKELVRRLGYKQVAGHVFPVRTLSGRRITRRDPAANANDNTKTEDVTQRLVTEFVNEQFRRDPTVVPDWVVWHPSAVPLPPPPGRFVKTSAIAARPSGASIARQMMRAVV